MGEQWVIDVDVKEFEQIIQRPSEEIEKKLIGQIFWEKISDSDEIPERSKSPQLYCKIETDVRQAKKRVLIYGFRVIFSVKGYFSQTVEKWK